MSNEAFARVKIDALLKAQGWDRLDSNAMRWPWSKPSANKKLNFLRTL